MIAITAWSAVSPLGIGRESFAQGLRAGTVPEDLTVPGFVTKELLGPKGTTLMDRATALAVVTVGLLGADRADLAGDRTGIVLGTTSGTASIQREFALASYTRRRPYFVEPGMMPFALMNGAASQCGIWHGLRGPNTTLADGRLSGLTTLRYAARLIDSGRADRVLCGGVEELGEARARLRVDSGRLGEGCAALVVEPATAAGPLARVLAVDSGFAPDGNVRRALSDRIGAILRRTGVPAARLAAVVPYGLGDAGDQELAALRDHVGEARWILCADVIGDTGAASATFQIAALCSAARDLPADSLGLITSADSDGRVACALLALCSAPNS